MLRCGPFEAFNREGRQLFSGVHLELEEGRLAVLEGPSGSGKTTLLRLVAGLSPAPGVERRLADHSFDGQLTCWRARVTLLAQDAPMLPGSVEDNLRFPFQLAAGAGRVCDEDRIHDLMAALGLSDLPFDREARTLSGGERHRLALVRGLLWDPPVLLADEPLSGLDPESAENGFSLLLAQARRPGRAVLSTMHDPDLAAGADTRWRLDNGRLGGA